MALTEALLVIPLMMLVFAAMIEFGAMVFQWNQTVKALQVAARRAAVSTELTDTSSLNAYGTIPIAEPLPASSFASVVCGAGATPCDPVQLNRLLQGGDGFCGGYDPSGVVGVCDIAPFIRASHLRVGYHRSDLGYSGRPYGPVLTVTLEVRDLYFDFFILDKVMELFQPIGVPHSVPVPAHPVAITSEDLCNGKTCP
jgi:hypothetical protein